MVISNSDCEWSLYMQADIKENETANRKRSDNLIEPPGNYHGDMLRETSILLRDTNDLCVGLIHCRITR